MSPSMIFLLTAVLIIALVGVIYILFSRKSGAKLDVVKFQARWLEIENGLDKANESTWQLSIYNADKLLDKALIDSRYAGQTMGERMKTAAKAWSSADDIWRAHKIRNRLAHETNASVDYKLTIRALSAYKRALKDLGAI